VLKVERTLLTGASGFLGRAVCAHALRRNLALHVAARKQDSLPAGMAGTVVGNIDGATDWSGALRGCTVVMHLAARVHVMTENASDPLSEFRRVNVAGTRHLAREAAASGVRRFIFVSSVKVNGEHSAAGRPFTAYDKPSPEDPYGVSKAEAEQALLQVAAETGMEVVVVRPPLVYGPGVKANFASLLRWLGRGWPLPLGAVKDNRRSFVALDNLVDLLITCIDHPAAANQTTALLQRMGQALGKPARLLPVPPALLQWVAAALGKADVAQRLLGNLQVDITHTREALGWTPPVGVDEGLRRAVAGLAP
jgi:nucleoside-diphosphate-sugar epimerase